MTDLFCGQLCSTLTCQVCSKTSKTFDSFWDLPLPLPDADASDRLPTTNRFINDPDFFQTVGSVTLLDCLTVLTQQELLVGDNQVLCTKCQQPQDFIKKIKIFRPPRILVVHLKRFSLQNSTWTKNHGAVSFPSKLDLSEFMPRGIGDQPTPVYDLFAVSNHHGDVKGGHYTALCNASFSQVLDHWVSFNDSSVSVSRTASLNSSSAYVLFYKRTNDEFLCCDPH